MHWSTQFSQKRSVRESAFSASKWSDSITWEGCQVMTKGTRCPAVTVKVASWVKLWPCKGTGVLSQTASGPAMATSSVPARCTHGTTCP